VTDTRRGWWPALELALLAFTVVVCGSVALLAHAHASALPCDHQCDTSGSNRSTATATSHDSVDDGDDDGDDDDDDVGYALLAASIILTSDEGHAGPRIDTNVPLSLRSERRSSRGPPDYDHQSDTPGSNRWTATATSRDSSDDGDDDDDDDDDVGAALLATSITLTSDDGHDGPRVQTHVLLSLRSARLSSRGPPRGSPDRDLSSWTAGDSERHRRNSTDDDIDDDDDDDDDDGTGEFGRSSSASSRDKTWILILSEFDKRFSFPSDDHSLRAPPQ